MKNKISVNLQQNLLVSMLPAKSFAVNLSFFFFQSVDYLHKELGTMLQPMHGSTSAPNIGTKFHQFTVTTSLASCFGEMPNVSQCNFPPKCFFHLGHMKGKETLSAVNVTQNFAQLTGHQNSKHSFKVNNINFIHSFLKVFFSLSFKIVLLHIITPFFLLINCDFFEYFLTESFHQIFSLAKFSLLFHHYRHSKFHLLLLTFKWIEKKAFFTSFL